MRTTIKVLASLMILFAFACGGGDDTPKKAAEDPINPAARNLASDICTCVDSIAISPEEVDDYNQAVKSCFEDVIFGSKTDDVKMKDLLNAAEEICPESYEAYSEIQDME